jgi:hypothetical protein
MQREGAGRGGEAVRQNGGDNEQADAITRRLSQHSLVLTA